MRLYVSDGRWFRFPRSNPLGGPRPIPWHKAVEHRYRLRIVPFATDGSDAGLYGDGLRGALTGVHGLLPILARGTVAELTEAFGSAAAPSDIVVS